MQNFRYTDFIKSLRININFNPCKEIYSMKNLQYINYTKKFSLYAVHIQK